MPAAPLNGTLTMAAASLDPTADTITLQWDITQHLDGNPASMSALIEISMDAGVTWQPLVSGTRDKGYPPSPTAKTPGLASIGVVGIPGVGSAKRMVRATLTTTASVLTSAQLVPAVTVQAPPVI